MARYAAAVEAAGNYHSGDDYVVEFLGYRFSFSSLDFEERVTAAAVRLGLVPAPSWTRTRPPTSSSSSNATRSRRRAARSASTSSAIGTRSRSSAASRSSTGSRSSSSAARGSTTASRRDSWRWTGTTSGRTSPLPTRTAVAPCWSSSPPRAGTSSSTGDDTPSLVCSRVACVPGRSPRPRHAGLAWRAARARGPHVPRARRRVAAARPARSSSGRRRRALRDGRRGHGLARLGRLPLPPAQPAALHPARPRARLPQRHRAQPHRPRPPSRLGRSDRRGCLGDCGPDSPPRLDVAGAVGVPLLLVFLWRSRSRACTPACSWWSRRSSCTERRSGRGAGRPRYPGSGFRTAIRRAVSRAATSGST